MTCAAVLLAAGAGSRFEGSTHKLLARIGDATVFETALGVVLRAGFDEVVVVTGSCDLTELIPVGVTVVHNPRWAQGQATSLNSAVEYLQSRPHDAAVFGLADQPGVDVECWRALRDSKAPLAAAVYGDVRGNPVRLGRSVWPDLPTEGDHGARHVLRTSSDEVERVACRGRSDDIDTLEDLSSWS